MEPRERFWRTISVLALVLCALLLGDRYLRAYFLTESAPRQPAPRADLAGEEARTTSLFAKTAPSVVAIYARKGGGRAATPEGVGTGSGFVWDRAGHIVTNHHVIDQATERRRDCSAARRRCRPASSAPPRGGPRRAQDRRTRRRPAARSPSARQHDLAGRPVGLRHRQPVRPVDADLTTGVISALDRRYPHRIRPRGRGRDPDRRRYQPRQFRRAACSTARAA